MERVIVVGPEWIVVSRTQCERRHGMCRSRLRDHGCLLSVKRARHMTAGRGQIKAERDKRTLAIDHTMRSRKALGAVPASLLDQNAVATAAKGVSMPVIRSQISP